MALPIKLSALRAFSFTPKKGKVRGKCYDCLKIVEMMMEARYLGGEHAWGGADEKPISDWLCRTVAILIGKSH